jgi:hypothetical protein
MKAMVELPVYDFPIVWLLAYPKKIIPETGRAQCTKYVWFYFEQQYTFISLA